MIETAVDDLIGSSEALIAALDAQDIEAIEGALPAFGASLAALKSSGKSSGKPSGGRERSPGLSASLEQALKLADVARIRVHYLADRTRQQIDMLATAAGRFDCTPATYARPR